MSDIDDAPPPPPPPRRSKMPGPQNYHEIPTGIGGKDGVFATLSNPKNFKPRDFDAEVAVMKALKEEKGVDFLISVHDSHDPRPAAEAAGLECVWIPLRDCYYEPTNEQSRTHPPEVLDEIVQTLKEQHAGNNKKVAVTCGAGNGRSGVVAACVNLTEKAEAHPEVLDMDGLEQELKLSMAGPQTVSGPVFACVNDVRTRANPQNEKFVELGDGLDSIIDYKQQLQQSLQQETRVQQEPQQLPPVDEVAEDVEQLADESSRNSSP